MVQNPMTRSVWRALFEYPSKFCAPSMKTVADLIDKKTRLENVAHQYTAPYVVRANASILNRVIACFRWHIVRSSRRSLICLCFMGHQISYIRLLGSSIQHPHQNIHSFYITGENSRAQVSGSLLVQGRIQHHGFGQCSCWLV